MGLTVALVVAEVLDSMFGVQDQSRLPDSSLLNRVLYDINAVRQSIWCGNRTEWLIRGRDAETLRAPSVQTGVTLTAGARTLSGGAFAAWMDGCTCQCAGEPVQNRIVQTAVSTWTLEAPFRGTTTAVGTITVYADVLTLAAAIRSVDRPVELEGIHELQPMRNAANLRRSAWPTYGFPGYTANFDYRDLGGYITLSGPRTARTPLTYLIEAALLYGGATVLRIRIDPMPDIEYTLRWNQCKLPAAITDVTDTTSSLTPHAVEESTFLPLLRDRLKSHPSFSGDKAEIAKDASLARDSIMNAIAIGRRHLDSYIDASESW